MPRQPADPAAVARGLAALEVGDVASAETASGLHRGTLYRWKARRDAGDVRTLAALASVPPPPVRTTPPAAPTPGG